MFHEKESDAGYWEATAHISWHGSYLRARTDKEDRAAMKTEALY